MSAEDDGGFVEADPLTIADVGDEPLDTLRCRDLRLRIAKEVGLNRTPRVPFGKADLNAIHAYLTGEHAYPKRDHGTGRTPSKGELRTEVAVEVGISSYLLDPETIEAGADVAPDGSKVVHGCLVRPYRKAELIALCEAVEGQRDARDRPT